MSVAELRARLLDQVDRLHAVAEQLADPAVDLVPPTPEADPVEHARRMLREIDATLLDLRVAVWRRQREQGVSSADIGARWARTRQHVNRALRGKLTGR